MELANRTFSKDFILIGFSKNVQTCILLFIFFVVIYLLTMLGNGFLIFTVIMSPQIHNPMYFFLCNLSFLDLCISCCIIPKILFDLFSKHRKISFISCLVQMNTGVLLGGIECILLTVMAYDRYVAICFPLHYTTIINWTLCKCLTILIWVVTFIVTTVPTLVRPFDFCKENILDHFCCEILAVLDLACGDLSFYNTYMLAICFFLLVLPLVFIVISYIYIIISILKIHSEVGRSKVFSTCTSHLTVVLMFFVTNIMMYMGHARSSLSVKYTTLLYGVMTPALNPFIYSLRNNEVKEASRKLLLKHSS